MDVSGVSIAPIAQVNPQQDVKSATQAHDKALEIQEKSATQVTKSAPDPESSMGQNIDVEA